MSHQRLLGFGNPHLGQLQGIRGSVDHQEAEDAQGMELLQVLPHGLPRQRDGGEILSAPPLAETGSAAEATFRRAGGGEGKRGKDQRAWPQKRVATWCFPAFGRNDELVWLRATKSCHVWATRITHQAAMWLGLPQSVTEAY